MDALPVISQLKSLVQAVCGQTEQARQTQENFSRQCPVISQARSAVEAMMGDQVAARETQKQFGGFVVGVVNSVPVVGHISGGIHYVVGDKNGGDQAMKAASHTAAVMAGGVGGFLVGGPIGAVGLGIAAGVAIDGVITGVDTAVHWEEEKKVRTYGLSEPLSDPTNAGKWFDATCGVALDGVTGFGAGKLAQVQLKNVRSGRAGAVVPKEAVTIGVGSLLANAEIRSKIFQIVKGGVNIINSKGVKKIIDWVIEKILTKIRTMQGEVCSKIALYMKYTKVYIIDVSQENLVAFSMGIGKDDGNCTIEFKGKTVPFSTKNNKTYLEDATGEKWELQEDHVYSLSVDGEVEKILDETMKSYIVEVIERCKSA